MSVSGSAASILILSYLKKLNKLPQNINKIIVLIIIFFLFRSNASSYHIKASVCFKQSLREIAESASEASEMFHLSYFLVYSLMLHSECFQGVTV